jgi:hypothetical protein
MSSRVRWLIVCLVLSLISTVAITFTIFPTWRKTYGDALGWALIGSELFLLATLIMGLAIGINREAPLPTGVIVVVALLLFFGVVWALLWTVAVGL